MEFRGREADLAKIDSQLQAVRDGRGTTRGRALVVTGRRRVGKSRLVQEFCDRSGAPTVIFQATRGRAPTAERAEFMTAVAQSPLPGADLVAGLQAGDWNQALRALAAALPDDAPAVVVLDEVPWLTEQAPDLEGALQTVWDQHLAAKPVLLLLVGSDISVMNQLQEHGRPFFGRATPLRVDPLHVADVQDATGLDAATAVDALLITGGFPEIVRSWSHGTTRHDFLRESFADPLSPLLVAGELTLLGEFPESSQARAVLEAIGTGDRTFTSIASGAGGDGAIRSGALGPVLKTLQAKQVVSVDRPLSTTSDTKNNRYRVADPYLRFWLAFAARAIPLVERGRGDVALDRVERGWSAWRGRAVEPFVRASLERLLPDDLWPATEHVGGWWNRRNNPEIDLVGADRTPVARSVQFVGSIKWHENQRFGRQEYDALARAALAVPGADDTTPLVAVSRAEVDGELPLAATWGPEELVSAWRRAGGGE